MSEVKWIKITTNMFDDEKIDFIESLPESDAILIIWIKLLTLAGKCNAGGFIYLTENIPYTTEMLAHTFRRPLNTVKLALETLKNLEMIDYTDEGFLNIVNWEKHQNVEGLERIREQTRKRVARYRERQKELSSSNVTCNVTVTQGNATEEDIDIERDIDKDIDIERDIDTTSTTPLTQKIIKNIIKEWNKLNLQQLRAINRGTNRHKMLQARIKEYSLDEVIQGIRNINQSSFLKGQNQRNWVITFDWFIKPNNFVKVLENNYKDKDTGSGDDYGW
ncbi:MAG TPA: hypothetical protein GX526_01090 [Thermoanaerobacterales bacterium]|nr:hypothetical protein [Thermoanaerobacterales bacterium]